jgi:Fe2+ transport system protein B
VILNILDSTNLKRNLYLTTQLLEFEIPILVVLNIWDEAVEKGISVDFKKLENLLCSPVIPASAKKRLGIDEILDKIIQVYENKKFVQCEHFEVEFEKYLKEVLKLVEIYQPVLLNLYPKRYLAVSLLEGSLKDNLSDAPAQELEKLREKLKASMEKTLRL